MQVILLERVVNLGNLGDIVKVKDGYGRNYLIPQGKAKRATEANKAEFAVRRAELEKQQAEQLTAEGFEVAKSEVRMPNGPLKAIGDHTVSVALHHDVVVDITVSVLGEA